MSTHNIHFYDKILKYSKIFDFLSCRNNFLGTKNVVEIATVNESSVFESLRFYCTRLYLMLFCQQ